MTVHIVVDERDLLPTRQRQDLAVELTPGWEHGAACGQADPDAWFPDPGSLADRQVFATCGRCPVRRPCLAAALLHAELGVWAGLTEDDRRPLRRLLRSGARATTVLNLGLELPLDDDTHPRSQAA